MTTNPESLLEPLAAAVVVTALLVPLVVLALRGTRWDLVARRWERHGDPRAAGPHDAPGGPPRRAAGADVGPDEDRLAAELAALRGRDAGADGPRAGAVPAVVTRADGADLRSRAGSRLPSERC